jgi:hypothetical protein
MKRSPLPLLIGALGIIIFSSNAVALAYYLYWRIPWLDIPMHFLGGLWVGLSILWLYYESGYIHLPKDKRGRGSVLTLALAGTFIIGVLWEIFEFSLDTFIVFQEVYNIGDTLLDLFMDEVGALVAAMVCLWMRCAGKSDELEEKIEENIIES